MLYLILFTLITTTVITVIVLIPIFNYITCSKLWGKICSRMLNKL